MTMIDWRARASCRGRDPEMFFPVGDAWEGESNERRAEQAKAVCAVCPVRALCLADALERGDAWAVLGGTLPEERRTPAYAA
jgi:WhiB family transcriptional regulator, redox-sensing transcriptional regulator